MHACHERMFKSKSDLSSIADKNGVGGGGGGRRGCYYDIRDKGLHTAITRGSRASAICNVFNGRIRGLIPIFKLGSRISLVIWMHSSE